MVGSPPCMRGKAVAGTGDGCAVRITPAHAGKSGAVWALAVPAEGSPPRMRGEEEGSGTPSPENRITPAHAGRSACRKAVKDHRQDHPRACGEKYKRAVNNAKMWGSPPRMRGEAFRASSSITSPGITPALAGRSTPLQRLPEETGDHPRACGEKSAADRRDRGGSRITPAHAGRSHNGYRP